MTQRNEETLAPSSLDEVIAEYLLAVESGARPVPQEWVERHPAVADGLRAYFADQDRFDRAAGPLKDAMAEIGEHEGRQYFSMKLIEGRSLRREIGRFNGRAAETARLMLTVARAVQYAHQRGLIHRDLKPANILLDRHDEPHVTDFGLAERFGPDADANQLTQSGAVMGTP